MCLCLECMIQYKSTNGVLVDQIITGDETSVHHVTLKTKTSWYGDTLILFQKKFKTVDLVPRIMATVIWNAEDPCWWTCSAEVRLHAAHYCNTPDKLKGAVQIKRL